MHLFFFLSLSLLLLSSQSPSSSYETIKVFLRFKIQCNGFLQFDIFFMIELINISNDLHDILGFKNNYF